MTERLRDERGRFAKNPTQQALTAAAFSIPTSQIEKKVPRAPQGWQDQAWRLWAILGVLHFPTTFKAKQVGRLKWTVNINGEDLDEEKSAEIVEGVSGTLGTREAARRLALNFEVAGEVYYARKADDWIVYASVASQVKEKLKQADIVVHGLNPDPVNPELADSALRAAIGTAEQIRLMAAMSRAQDRNRLAQRGIILKPKEGQFPEGDDFQANFEEAMTAPIGDEYAPSAVVPLVVDFPAEYIEHWRHFVIESPYDEKLMERLDATIKQLAIELDQPPEMLLGNMDSNHWNAWLSSEDNYSAHVEPTGVLVGEVFAQAIMKAGAAGGAGELDVKVRPDPTDLLARRSTVQDAFEALKLGVVGFDYVRDAIGANDEDAPSGDELALIFALQGRTMPGDEPEMPQVGTDETGAPALPQASPVVPNGNGAIAASIPRDPLETLGRALSDLDIRLLSRLEGFAEMATETVRERVSTDQVGAQEAVAAEVDRIGRAWSREIAAAHRALGGLGIDATGPEWQAAKDASVVLLTEGMTAYITGELDRTDSEMHALPVDLLRSVLATAGGSGEAVTAAIVNPPPTFADPQGFAIGVLSMKGLRKKGVELVQYRFRYGSLPRSEPFEPHKAVDGQYLTPEGRTAEGYYPGDHKGCECSLDPVFREVRKPQEV